MRRLPVAFVALALVGGASLLAGPLLAQSEGAPPPPAAAPEDDAPPADAAPEGDAPPAPAEEAAPVQEEAAAPVPSADELQTADEAYNLKVREIEGRINDLKEQIHRSKSKLTLLTEQIAGGLGTGATVVIIHENKMGGNFLLTEAHYFLDGQPIWQETDETGETLSAQKQRPLLDGNLVEGSHTLTVQLVYKGNGSGVFSYMAGYTMTVRNALTFTAEPGKVMTIYATGYEKGNFTTELTERPAIMIKTELSEDQRPKSGAR